MTLIAGYDWRHDENKGRWRLWEVDKSTQVMQWYNQVSGRERLVRDQDNRLLPSFESVEEGESWLSWHRWGRVILGLEK